MNKSETLECIKNSILDRLFGDCVPETVYKVTCRNVFGDKWRINVYMSGENTKVIPYSYLSTIIDGEIVDSIPDIVRNKATELNEPARNKFKGSFQCIKL